MSNVISLGKYRKRVQKEEAVRTAERNRARFGRSKAQKRLAELERERGERALDDKQRRRDSADDSSPEPEPEPGAQDP